MGVMVHSYFAWAYIYIISTHKGDYNIGYEVSESDLFNTLSGKMGKNDHLFELITIPHKLLKPAYNACIEFVDGRLSLSDLETRISEMARNFEP